MHKFGILGAPEIVLRPGYIRPDRLGVYREMLHGRGEEGKEGVEDKERREV